jgi:hypothetical protein
MDSGSVKTAVRKEGTVFDFHVSPVLMQASGFYQQGFWPNSPRVNGTSARKSLVPG